MISWPSYIVYTEYSPVMSPRLSKRPKRTDECLKMHVYQARRRSPFTSNPPRYLSHPFNRTRLPKSDINWLNSSLPFSTQTVTQYKCIRHTYRNAYARRCNSKLLIGIGVRASGDLCSFLGYPSIDGRFRFIIAKTTRNGRKLRVL